MRKLLHGFAILLTLMPGVAFGQSVLSFPAPWAPIGNTVSLAASSTTSRVQLGWVATGATPPPASAWVCNLTSTNAYVVLGGSTVTATSNGFLVIGGTCNLISVNNAGYLAAITGSSTTTLVISTGNGSPIASNGTGSVGSLGMSITASNAVLPDARTNLGLGTASSPVFTGATLSGMTAGSVLFAGAGGVVSQDNANLFWDDSTNRLGIGNTIPAATLDVGATASAFRVRNLFTDASNGEWFEASWAGNALTLGTNKNGTGVLRQMNIGVGGTAIVVETDNEIRFPNRVRLGDVSGIPFDSTRLVLVADDVGAGQIAIFGETNKNKFMSVGYNTTGNYAFISSGISGSSWSPIILASAGTSRVGIQNTIPAVTLDVGATAAGFRVRNLFTDASNGEWGEMTWSSNILNIGTDKNGSGAARAISIRTGGTEAINIGTGQNVTFAALKINKGYAVASLPAGITGAEAYVTDQLTTCPVLGGTLTGGGAVNWKAFYNGVACVHE